MRTKNIVITLQNLSEQDESVLSFINESAYSAILVQVFSGELERENIERITSHLNELLPENAVIIGATTSGEILDGEMLDHQVIISVSVFENTTLSSACIEQYSSYKEIGNSLAQTICKDNTKAVILFMDGLLINGEEVTNAFSEQAIGKPVMAGGMAGDYTNFDKTYVIYNQKVISNGAVAVALNSDTLKAFNSHNLSWTSLGPKMKITKSEGGRVYEIDNQPIIDIYRQYLGEDTVANMPDSTIEFPLIIQNQEIPVARSMVQVFEDGSIFFAGNLDEGTEVRFGIANAIELEKAQRKMRNELASQNVQSCYIYSCTARKAFLGNRLEKEFIPISEVAPVAGFFTYGEIYHFNEGLPGCPTNDTLLNVTTTVLGLTERESDDKEVLTDTSLEKPLSQGTRQSLSNSALINLVNETTKHLNQKLDENTTLIQFLNQYQTAINESFIVSKSDIYGTITFANPLFEKISGYHLNELLGKNHNLVRHPDTPKALFEDMWQTILSKKTWQGVIKNRAKGGQTYIVKTSIVPILDRDGEITEFLSLREDVTEQELQKAVIEHERAKVRATLDNQSSLVIMSNSKRGEIDLGNQAFLNYTGFKSLAGFKSIYRCICDLFVKSKDSLQKEMDGLPWYEYILQNPDKEHIAVIPSATGEHHLFSVTISLLPEEPDFFISNFYDITQVEKERLRAVKAEKAQSQFLANMSHELRTPINGILGFADLLGGTELNREQQQYVDILRSSSQHLLSVVNDILDISKIERGEIELHPQAEQVFVDLEKILISFSPVAEKKGIEYNIHLSSEMPECLVYDNTRLHQILANLVSNAIKFTPENGRVTVTVTLQNLEDDTAKLLFSVKDTGIGIPEDKQDQVFLNFKQACSSTTRDFGGTGLGLSIATQLVEKMSGEPIKLESEVNQGSHFYFTLPMQVCKTKANIKEALQAVKVGLIADESQQTESIINFLNKFEIQYTQDGFGRCKAQCNTSGCIFDILLIQSNDKFKQMLHMLDKTTLYVFFSEQITELQGNPNVVQIQDFENNPSHLYELLIAHIKKTSSDLFVNKAPTFNQKILLAEDNAVNQTLMEAIFKKLNIDADLAQNGEEAVEMYKQGNYSLVLMDINMPVMTGEEAMDKLKEYASEQQIELCPIVALTANVLPEQVKEYQNKGFHSHLAKPLQISKFKTLLESLIS